MGEVAFAAFSAVIAAGHIGSPDTWFEGDAGPYRVVVHVTSPGVIPGIATVTVATAPDARVVTALVNRYDAIAVPPPADTARAVEGQPGVFSTPLWVMTGGSNTVAVTVSGPRGAGALTVPVGIVAHRRLRFARALGIGLGAVGLVLFAGLVTIIGAAARDSGVEPGEEPGPERRRRGRIAMAAGAGLLAVALFGGNRWWQVEDQRYQRSMFKPLATAASARKGADGEMLTLTITDTSWRRVPQRGDTGPQQRSRFTPLVPDHGKLMHMFVIRDDLSAFAHVHPASQDTVSFVVRVPPLPSGRYRVFGDITHESGFAQTLSAMATVQGSARPDPNGSNNDDAWYVGAASDTLARLGDGSAMRWLRGTAPIVAGAFAPLRFDIRDASGSPAHLEPYMGMSAHAVVVRHDGAVFIHLHPMGTISAAAQLAFSLRQPGDSTPGTLGRRMTAIDSAGLGSAMHGSGSIVSFPYAFPSAGRYRVWVQVKRGGRVLTGAFDADVIGTGVRD